MRPIHILGLILLWTIILSGMLTYFEAQGIREPLWSMAGSTMFFSILFFWWYWTDSTLRLYRRSPLLNVAVVAAGFIAIPYYLLRSRPRGQRAKAIVSMAGFFALVVVASYTGALLVAWVS